MSENNISNEATKIFLKQFNERMHQIEREDRREKKIVEEKSTLLIPLRKMLKSFMDAGVYVTNHSIHEHSSPQKARAPQPLQVWEAQSSPHFFPGSSLYLDNPAHLEIAISNPVNKHEGIFVIKCATPHPFEYILRGPFNHPEEACNALAQFLSVSTVRIDRPDLLS